MKYRPVLIMLVTVIVAALVAYALSRRPTSEEMADRQRRVLPGLRADRIAAVEIETGEHRIVCQRDAADGERWLITAPLAVRADRWEVEGIIDRFETAETMLKPIRPTGDRPLDLSETPHRHAPGLRIRALQRRHDGRHQLGVLLPGQPSQPADSPEGAGSEVLQVLFLQRHQEGCSDRHEVGELTRHQSQNLGHQLRCVPADATGLLGDEPQDVAKMFPDDAGILPHDEASAGS